MKKVILFIFIILFASTLFILLREEDVEAPKTDPPTQPDTSDIVEPVAVFDKTQYSLSDPTSIWVVVNKQNSIPIDYTPDLVVPDVRLRLAASNQQMNISSQIQSDVEAMFAAASEDGVSLVFGSGYRSADLQRQFYDSYVATDGQALADTYSARPGHSEHQTGFGLDVTSPDGVCHLEICWQDTPEGKWVRDNAHRFGFIIRYLEGKENITGYQYEPWHLRFVGVEAATEIYNTGLTFEEFFDLPRAPDYL